MADSKDKEPEVVFIGDSLVQLMHQCEVRPISLLLPHPGLPSLTHLDQTSGQAEYGVPEITSGSAQHPDFQCKVQHNTKKEVCALALSGCYYI